MSWEVTESVTKTVIDVEKMLCEPLKKEWKPSGMSIETLIAEIKERLDSKEKGIAK